jgi:hypothetical protein
MAKKGTPPWKRGPKNGGSSKGNQSTGAKKGSKK